ncbi:UNVERIFIED_CONTAM: hypothetical protein K2H54_039072, partial [Gekko kuhli]
MTPRAKAFRPEVSQLSNYTGLRAQGSSPAARLTETRSSPRRPSGPESQRREANRAVGVAGRRARGPGAAGGAAGSRAQSSLGWGSRSLLPSRVHFLAPWSGACFGAQEALLAPGGCFWEPRVPRQGAPETRRPGGFRLGLGTPELSALKRDWRLEVKRCGARDANYRRLPRGSCPADGGREAVFSAIETFRWLSCVRGSPGLEKLEDFFHQNSTPEVGVLSFYDVWNRSSCQPMEKLVNIVSEYPCEVEHMFSPSCVSLHRCSGCCGDETLQCVPTEMTNVTMQLLRMKSGEQASYVEMSFAEHKKCLCRLRQEVPKPG